MINGKTVIAIVPARGGSKGLPKKNIKNLNGKPLIAWSIEVGLESQYIDELLVTTDSEEIAKIACNLGALVPFIRPAELAEDTATSISVIEHALNFCANELGKKFDIVVLLEPTSPLRVTDDVDKALELLVSNPHASAVVGICKAESQHPAFLVEKGENNMLSGYNHNEFRVVRRQDIRDIFFFEGSVYVSYATTLLNKQTFYHERTLGYEVPKWKSLEIDDLDDFVMVEALMRHRSGKA